MCTGANQHPLWDLLPLGKTNNCTCSLALSVATAVATMRKIKGAEGKLRSSLKSRDMQFLLTM